MVETRETAPCIDAGFHRGGLPAWTYGSEALTDLEKDRLFRRHWQLACHVSEVPEPGSSVAFDCVGERAIVMRDRDAAARAFHNLCRHRGARVLVRSRGRCKRRITCPFQGWTCNFDGTLRGAARPDTLPPLNKAGHGLKPIELEIWMGFVFVRFRPGGQPSVARLMARHEAMVAPYRVETVVPVGGAFRAREMAVNWKIVRDVDNEGDHVPIAHPGLWDLHGGHYASHAMQDHTSLAIGRFSPGRGRTWSVRAYKSILPDRADLPEDTRRAWFYIGLFPNQVISFHPDSIGFYPEMPISARRTLQRGMMYRWPDEDRAMQAARWLAGRIDNDTIAEDARLIDWSHEAMEASAFDGLILSDLERTVADWHTELKRAVPEMAGPQL